MTTENQTTTAAGATQTETHSRVTVETSDREPVAAPAAETTAQAESEAASGAAENETEEGQEAGAQEGAEEEEGDEGEESQETQPKKPKNGFKKKINKEVSRRKAAEQERDYWRQQALSGQRPQESRVDPKTETPKAAEGKPKASDFEQHEAYVEALTDWKIQQRDKERDTKAKEQAATAQIQAQVDAFRSRVKEQEAKLPDYRDVVESCDVEPSPVVRQLLLEAENGAELTYHLAKNPEELERISKLGPIAAAREMGKFEAKYLSAQKEEPKETKKITKAPPPIKPVGSKTPAASAGFREGMSFADFKKWRESSAS